MAGADGAEADAAEAEATEKPAPAPAAEEEVAPAKPARAPPTTTPYHPKPMQFASLYVGDLHRDVGEATLFEAFSQVGSVASCRVCRDSVTRKSLGYGYVNYHSMADAERAIEHLNYMSIKGKPCRIMWSQRDAAQRRNMASNVFVKNLDESIDSKALHDTFSIFGNILSCKVSTDNSGKSRGYGFVHYEAEEAAKQAIARVNGMRIGDNTVFVGPFIKREKGGNDLEFTNVYVKHLPPLWDEAKLSNVLGEFGEITSLVVLTDQGRRFALVNFKESDAAKQAIASLHRKDLRDEEGVEVKEEDLKKEEAKECEAKADEAKAEVAEGEAKTEKAKTDADEGEAEDAEDNDEAKEAEDKEEDKEEEEEIPMHLLYVQRAQPKSERRRVLREQRQQRKGSGRGGDGASNGPAPRSRLCVRNLSEDMTVEGLREIFEPYGKIVSAVLRTDDDSGKCRGLGWVVFASAEEAAQAVQEVHLRVVDGTPLNVSLAERRRRGWDRARDGLDGDLPGATAGPPGPSGRGRGEPRDGAGPGRGGGGRKGGKGRGRGGGGQGWGGGQFAGQRPPVPLPARGPMPYGMPQPPLLGMPPPGGFPPNPYPLLPGMPGMPGRPPLPGPLPQTPLSLPGGPGLPAALAALASAGPRPGATLPPPLPAPLTPQMLQQPLLHPMQASSLLPPPLPAAPPLARPLPPALTREAIAALPPHAQRQHLGERLYALNYRYRPDLAGKITGMMLELDVAEIFGMLESEEKLREKLEECISLLAKAVAPDPTKSR